MVLLNVEAAAVLRVVESLPGLHLFHGKCEYGFVEFGQFASAENCSSECASEVSGESSFSRDLG